MAKSIDPVKIARLEKAKYESVMLFSDMVVMQRREEKDIPEDVYTEAFMSMRDCGSKVSYWSDMHISAVQIEAQRFIIERLRKHFQLA